VTAPVTNLYRSTAPAGHDGFPQLVRAEWTKFRSVRGWIIAIFAAALVTLLTGILTGINSQESCNGGPCHYVIPTGPGGEAVTDSYYFVHQPLSGNGTITVQVTSLTGEIQQAGGQASAGQAGAPGAPPARGSVKGVQPWSKAGLIVTSSTKQGAPYAAVVVTGSHGVRMQYNYVHDTAASPGPASAASPRWLRLTRAGDTLTGYDSADGTHWTEIGTADLAGLPSTVQAGIFVTSPEDLPALNEQLFTSSGTSYPTSATATFDRLGLQDGWSGGAWSGSPVTAPASPYRLTQPMGGSAATNGGFTVSGSGDIAPAGGTSGNGSSLSGTLSGMFIGLIALVVVGALFITAEYRRGLIRLTIAATPRRGRILTAKAVVVGVVTFVTGLVGAAAAVIVGKKLLLSNGNNIYPVSTATEVRMIVGTAAFLAAAAVLALGVGAMLRHSAGAVTTVIAAIILPYILAVTTSVLPVSAAQWLLRVTPAAGFAVQQVVRQYPQVDDIYTPQMGYFPLAPWAGFAVLCGWAAAALAVAVVVIRRRDA
jgi:ABC-type transport system involved in multi-copper enzyme maturation permease subunit